MCSHHTVQKYKSTINNALSEVGDILGDFGVPDQRVPDAGRCVYVFCVCVCVTCRCV